jgi:peptide/nickel transport system permease protein
MERLPDLLLRRFLTAIPVVLIVIVASYVLIELAPGDAVDTYLAISGGDSEFAANFRRLWGLDQGAATRFIAYLGRLVTLDLGQSVIFSRPVFDVILERLPTTLLLMGTSIFVAFGLGTTLGLLAGSKPYSPRDRILSFLGLVLYAVPSFWLGLILIIIFAVWLNVAPVGGFETIASDKEGLERVLDIAWHLALPVFSLGLIYLGLYLRLMRSGMIEVWRLDFIRTAQAKGLSQNRIALDHVARNALLPVITVLGLQLGSMLGGSVVIESVFAIPGFGRLAYEAVIQRDFALLIGVVLIGAITVIIINIVIDIAYGWLDPRIGTQRKVKS